MDREQLVEFVRQRGLAVSRRETLTVSPRPRWSA
jgi:hypothetical protein